MDEKRRDTASSPAAPSSAEMDSASMRRRAGALKRKANTLSSSNSSPAPSKRITRDKSNLILLPQVNHNGPLTRARHGAPNNLDSAYAFGSADTKPGELVLVKEVAKDDDSEDLNKASEEWEALEAKIEAEFEAIRSRDSNAHVVPNHCGWFSWKKTHPLEEWMLPSFFNGKSAARNPDLYLEIRNWIMKKFHANPNVQIEQKDLLELEVGDLDARLEVMEFLDYWGLINFHPFPPLDSFMASVNGDRRQDSLIEKLYRFEAMESGPPIIYKPSLTSPAPSSGFLPESALAEELGKAEEPAVEYHCNSCSGDCSRKRYHCQKQADFDLCTDCFNNGKFGSHMSSSDFILMESAEVPGVSSGKWTDQETLLLLEALELFKENWNEIAEHVATKTKAQCILHFVQMPIEDTFLDCDDEVETKDTKGSAAATDEASVPHDVPQTLESKSNPNDGQVQASVMDTSKTKDASEAQVSPATSQRENENEVRVSPETSKLGDVNETKFVSENNENIALKALREAFEAVGYQLTPESTLSFADVGNPVMALAGFLTKLVEPDIAAASARSSLKLMSCCSPGLLLAAKHCFILEDPPTDKKESASECVVNESTDQDVEKEKVQEDKSDKEDKSSPVSDGNSSGNRRNHDAEGCDATVSSLDDQLAEKKEPTILASDNLIKNSNMNDLTGSESQKDHQPSAMNNSDEPESQVSPSSVKDTQGGDRSVAEPSQPAEGDKNKDMPDSVPSETSEPSKQAEPDGEPSETAKALDKTNMTSDFQPSEIHEQQQPLNSNSACALSLSAAALKDEDMLDDSLPAERKGPPQPDAANLVKQNGTSAEGKMENCNSEEPKEGYNINKLKRAAVTALSAAAVKAKLLADQEEDQIRQLATSLVEKQLHKLETKLAFFSEMECVMMRVKEQLERSKQKLYHERAQIIATRLGLPASIPANRIAANFANAFARPPMSMTSPRPPLSRPMGPMASVSSNPFATIPGAGSSIQHASQDNSSSVVTK